MKYLAVHHTAVEETGTHQLFAVNRYHKNKWNMKSTLGWYVGYNYFIDYDGTTTQCRSLNEETIANKGHNCDVESRCDTVSACFALDGDKQVFTDAQIKAWIELREKYSHLEVTLHKNLQVDRICPGKKISINYLNSLFEKDNNKEKAESIAKLQSSIDRILAILEAILRKFPFLRG